MLFSSVVVCSVCLPVSCVLDLPQLAAPGFAIASAVTVSVILTQALHRSIVCCNVERDTY